MALLYIDGFDIGDYAQRWTMYGSSHGTSTATRFGTGRSLILSDNDSNVNARRTFSNSTTVYFGTWFKYGTTGYTALMPIVFYGDSGATQHLSLYIPTAGSPPLHFKLGEVMAYPSELLQFPHSAT